VIGLGEGEKRALDFWWDAASSSRIASMVFPIVAKHPIKAKSFRFRQGHFFFLVAYSSPRQ
jgi:hypothetical protein